MAGTRRSSAEAILKVFADITSAPRDHLVHWKEQSGKKVVGCFPMDIPEELIHAAGMLPAVLWENSEPVTSGHAHISPYNCGIIRSIIDESARGASGFFDGIVTYETCLQARHLEFILRKTGHPAHFLRIFLPGVITGAAGRTFMVENLKRLMESLERIGGGEVRGDRIQRSIRIYNENRGLLRKVYQLRRNNPGLLRARDVSAIVHSSMLMLKEEHTELLRRLVEDLEHLPPVPAKGPGVILTGSLCEAPRTPLLDLIEEAGMVVLDDDLYVGSRYFANDVDAEGDPLVALANRYLERVPPSPTKVDMDSDWGEYIVEMAARNRAAAVISLMVKFCPPHLAYYPDIERKIKAAGLRALMVEMEHEVDSVEQVKTRLRAFAESLGRP